MNVINLFDQENEVNVFQTQTRQGITVTEAEFYRGIDAQALLAAQNITLDPRFLMGCDFQVPRAVRFGAKWSFQNGKTDG